MFLPPIPSAGQPLSVSWARSVVDSLRDLYTRVPFIPHPASFIPPHSPLLPWSVTFDGADAVFSRCHWYRSPVTHKIDTLSHTVASDDGTIHLSARFDTETGLATILEGADMDSVIDQTLPADPRYILRYLYVISKATVSGTVSIFILEDHRFQPAIGLYV